MNQRRDAPPTTLGFLLVDDFALMSYASVIEPFRAANVLAGRPLYRWNQVSLGGGPARASNGASLLCDTAVGDPATPDMVFVFMGGDPAAFRHEPTFAWLRRLARDGARIGGVSGGAYALARAGLLQGYRCTVHWEHRAAFCEAFPDLSVSGGLYEIDRGRLTCAGGIAALDMVIELIARDHVPALSAAVGEWYIRTHPRSGADAQRTALRDRYGVADEKVLTALARMEASLDRLQTGKTLAAETGVTARQLERLFARRLGVSIGRQHLAMRLDHAGRLVRQTALPLAEVAAACGFSGTSALSRAYRGRFGKPPGRDRHSSAGSADFGGPASLGKKW